MVSFFGKRQRFFISYVQECLYYSFYNKNQLGRCTMSHYLKDCSVENHSTGVNIEYNYEENYEEKLPHST